MRSNDTLGNTPLQLISDFFHVDKMLCVLSMLSKLPPRVCWGGGEGGNRLPGLVTKQQAVEFPQVQTSINYLRSPLWAVPRKVSFIEKVSFASESGPTAFVRDQSSGQA